MTASTPRLRLDRSKPFATIHGQRHPDDPHLRAKFQQDGIHYDSEGLHIDSLIADDETRALVDRRLKRQARSAPKKDGAGEGSDGDPGDGSSGSSGDDDVNLEAWLRGEAQYQWFAITKLVRDRFKMNITKQADMVDFLVNEQKVIPLADVDPKLAALLTKTQA